MTWTAATRRRWDLPWLKAAVTILGLEKDANEDAINVVRSLLDLKNIVLHVKMISSNYFSNMIVRVIMVPHKMCSRSQKTFLMLKLLVGNVLHNVEKRVNMILLVFYNLRVIKIQSA